MWRIGHEAQMGCQQRGSRKGSEEAVAIKVALMTACTKVVVEGMLF